MAEALHSGEQQILLRAEKEEASRQKGGWRPLRPRERGLLLSNPATSIHTHTHNVEPQGL